jgi:protoporphyrinogen/coproporphyrinogen III oxidase
LSDGFEPVDLAVIGGGISGLACAFWAKQRGRSVILFESSEGVGGCIKSARSGPYIADGGPQSFVSSKYITKLVSDAGLESFVLPASPGARTPYLYLDGRLVAVPQSPAQLICTPLLSPLEKIRLMREPFVRPRPADGDESVADFARRRIGSKVLERAVAPYVSGVFAGDPEKLSIQSAFPAIATLEREHGSLIRGALVLSKARKAGRRSSGETIPRRSFGFRGGNDVLPRGVAERLGTDIRLNSPVKALWQRGAWMEMLVGGKTDTRVVAKSVILATPAMATAELIEALEPAAANELRAIEYPAVAQVALSYPRDAIGAPLDGFGFLTPRSSGLRILGCVWNSAMFPDRCPEGEALVTAFLGGATDSSISSQTDEQLARQAHEDLRKSLRIREDVAPYVVAGFRWQEAIPQYNIGHAERLKVITACVKRLPQVRLCGSYLQGPSVGDCIATSEAALASLDILVPM